MFIGCSVNIAKNDILLMYFIKMTVRTAVQEHNKTSSVKIQFVWDFKICVRTLILQGDLGQADTLVWVNFPDNKGERVTDLSVLRVNCERQLAIWKATWRLKRQNKCK